jgi:hypothetical protein
MPALHAQHPPFNQRTVTDAGFGALAQSRSLQEIDM